MKKEIFLGRVSLEEVKTAGGCGADLLNPRAPILRLCSGPPSVQTCSRTLQSSWPYRRRCTKAWCSSHIKKTLGVCGWLISLSCCVYCFKWAVSRFLPHRMPVPWILNWVIVILSLIIDNKHSFQVRKMPTGLHLWALPSGIPVPAQTLWSAAQWPTQEDTGGRKCCAELCSFYRAKHILSSSPSCLFRRSYQVFNTFSQICLELNWNTHSVTGAAATLRNA